MNDADKLERFIANGQAMQRAVDLELQNMDATKLRHAAERLIEQAQRVESFMTFSPPQDRDLAAIALSVTQATASLLLEIDSYMAKWAKKR